MTERHVELHAASAFSVLEGDGALLSSNGFYGYALFHTSAATALVKRGERAALADNSLDIRSHEFH
jgi:hypothetical protein